MKYLFICCLLLSTLGSYAQQSIANVWNTGENNTKVEISEVDGVYEGKIISSDNKEVNVGKTLLKEIKSVDGEWKGKLYAPKRKEWLDATLKEENQQLIIQVSKGWVSKTIKWSKA
ncbi:MAG: hypothetical protein AAFY71_16895 [Bacteroidota bacterium]